MISYGFDIGTTTLRATAVKITLGPFRKQMVTPVGEPLVRFTPYKGKNLDSEDIVRLLSAWVNSQKLPTPEVGTLLFTGQAQRAPNATEVALEITNRWRGLLSAQLNPELETRVAAYGAGAVELSATRIGQPVLHIDIGGGTSNLAWIENGVIEDTACWDLGARKWILSEEGEVLSKTAQAEQLESCFRQSAPQHNRFSNKRALLSARIIASLILDFSSIPSAFVVIPWKKPKTSGRPLLSLSGGIVECIKDRTPLDFRYGDLGPMLAHAMLEVAEEKGFKVRLSPEHGRATALGVSSHSFLISGGSIFAKSTDNLIQVPTFSEKGIWEGPRFAVQLSKFRADSKTIQKKADELAARLTDRFPKGEKTVVLLVPTNLGKSLGHFLQEKLDPRFNLVVLDEIDIAPNPTSTIRTLDLRWSESVQRFTVVVKSLHLF